MKKKALLTIGAALVAALLYGSNYLAAALSAGSGFSAKRLCSGHFLSGMPGQQIVDEALITTAAVLSNVSFEIDAENRHVDARLFGMFQRRAVFNEGTGCTLLKAGKYHLQRELEVVKHAGHDASLPWPQGSAPSARNSVLEPLLNQAFAETDPLHPRHTKAVVVIHNGQLMQKNMPRVCMRTLPCLAGP